MNKINYKSIQKLNIDITKQLLKYITKEMQNEDLIDEIQFFHDGFIDHELAFNIWLSFDFIDKNGLSFIDKFLDAKGHVLSAKEQEILKERNKSNISLFEVMDIDNEFIRVIDLFEHKYHTLWEPDLSAALNVDDLIFGRVANLLGSVNFIGDINYLPVSARDTFLRESFRDFNDLRKTDSRLTIKEYLKNNSIKLYTIYTNCIFEIMEMEDDINSIFYDELDEFQNYLNYKFKNLDFNNHISNLIEFFEYYLVEKDLSLSDLDQIDFNQFFSKSIESSFILSIEDLNSYISTFKYYLEFLFKKDSKYKKAYENILDISSSRFQIAELFKNTEFSFKLDTKFSKALEGYLDDYSLILTMDFDKFMLYILNNPLKLTEKNKHIKRKSLLEINDLLESSIDVQKKAPNQKDFPKIQFFYNFGLDLKLISIIQDNLSLTTKGYNFLRLKDEEKYIIILNYMWSEDFISKITNIDNKNTLNKYKSDLIIFLSSLQENIYYRVSDVLSDTLLNQKFFSIYYPYLQNLKIIEYNLYPIYEIKVTPLGKVILNFLKSKNIDKEKCSIINLNKFKQTK